MESSVIRMQPPIGESLSPALREEGRGEGIYSFCLFTTN